MKKSTKLFILRKNKGMSIKELSASSGVNYWTLSAYEQRKRNINNARYETVEHIANALGATVSDILEEQYV